MSRRLIRLACLLLALAPTLARADVTVFAAASLKTALDRIAADFTAAEGIDTTISFAGSSTLARQIEQGAPADVFLSANTAWMDELEEKGLIVAGTRTDLLGNSIVLAGHDPAPATPLSLPRDWATLDFGSDGRLAMAMVDSVPAGIYGKQALTSLGLWEQVQDRVAQADNVRAALALVSLGEAPFGIVYATDAKADPNVHLWATFPTDSHDPIVYPAAATRDTAEARAFLAFLNGPAARAVFEAAGFTLLAPPE
ncbi:molybdate ABC transporter substrate-binding protein [Oceaniglobus roseus]|uniref:molybdate ABC transporter substrate-binding protein n=1 Tax=Oceaniglobus roseus TaxID=1737570 RepID=UPI000C7F3F97|nr:molybdate ABC transporter substrate-binding protein [Kandeliimicrobium roseum]